MGKSPRENRVPIMFSDAELEALDDWRFKNRVATRAEAIRRLCQVGMEYVKQSGHLADVSDQALKNLWVHFENVDPETSTNEEILRAYDRTVADCHELIDSLFLPIIELNDIVKSVSSSKDVGGAIFTSRKDAEMLNERISEWRARTHTQKNFGEK